MLKTSSSSLLVVKVHIYTNTHKSNKNCIVGNARAQFWQQMWMHEIKKTLLAALLLWTIYNECDAAVDQGEMRAYFVLLTSATSLLDATESHTLVF